MEAVKSVIKRTPLYPFLRDARILLRWNIAGRPAPPPHLIKQQTVREYGRKFHLPVFIETGTYRGDMVDAVKGEFDRIYSIELGPELSQYSKRRFAADQRITILQGDSGEVLRVLLKDIRTPCLFWLDSHFSGGDTARGKVITPILRELAYILKHPLAHRHVILIDDARLFNGRNEYPAMEELTAVLRDAGFEDCEVKDDIIRIRKS